MNDHEQIRELMRTWRAATQHGDVETVLSLMADDVVFLTSGRAPMSKSEFAQLSRVPAGGVGPRIEIESEIQDLQVSGDLAYCCSKLAVTVTPPGATQSIVRAGHVLTVFRREHGRWLLARDANLLTVVSAK